jgi:hypothetical protein
MAQPGYPQWDLMAQPDHLQVTLSVLALNLKFDPDGDGVPIRGTTTAF